MIKAVNEHLREMGFRWESFASLPLLISAAVQIAFLTSLFYLKFAVNYKKKQ